jgi:hypothetical protein
MITAKEAKALYDESGAEAKALLKTFEPKIIEAAKSGKRWIVITIGSSPTTKTPQPDSLQKRVMELLNELGYVSRWVAQYDDPYIPLGLVDDYDNGPMYINCGIHIGW